MSMRSKIMTIAVAGCLAASAGLVAGCSGEAGSSSSSASASASAAVEEEVLAQVGEGEDAACVLKMTNATGKAIGEVQVKVAGAGEYAPLAMSAPWAAEESVNVGFPKAQQEEGGEVELRVQYDMRVTYEDGTFGELHGLVPEGLSDAQLAIDAEMGLTYLIYTGEGGDAVDTLAAEKAFKEQAEAAAAEAAAAEAAAAAAQAPVDTGYSYDYSYADTGSSGSSGGSDPSQSEDQCVDGGVQLR